ncbi:hypothetical protein NHX12_025505, partial [Muraenolepis orangiensis]
MDPENTGFIAVENFTSLVEHHELQLDPSKLDMLFALVQSNEDGQVCYQELIELADCTRREILLDETGLGVYKRFVRYVAYEILPCETDRRWYFHQNRLCPPPVFMAVITIVQTYQPDFMKSPLVYHPGHRTQVWRFFSYMFMHLMIGVPLEMVHGILRISLLYMAGVVAVIRTVPGSALGIVGLIVGERVKVLLGERSKVRRDPRPSLRILERWMNMESSDSGLTHTAQLRRK